MARESLIVLDRAATDLTQQSAQRTAEGTENSCDNEFKRRDAEDAEKICGQRLSAWLYGLKPSENLEQG